MRKTILAGLRCKESEEVWLQKTDELRRLCVACGCEICGEVYQKADRAQSRTLIGTGKCQQLREIAEEQKAELIVFLNDLSGIQNRNLEELTGFEVADRSAVILEIFDINAKTRQARLQVEAARLSYQLPRLIDGQLHFDQQQGGGVRNRGAGETRLERSRRVIEKKIKAIRTELDQLKVQQRIQSQRRRKSGIPLVCLIGYSNAGKSSLMNLLLKRLNNSEQKQVEVRDQLFATLDSFTRRIEISPGHPILLSDTVGFVRDLPDFLLEAFETTLQQITGADCLLEVIDISDPQWQVQHEIVTETLRRLNSLQIPRILVYNKCDRNQTAERCDGVMISCMRQSGISELVEVLKENLGIENPQMNENDEF